jgi:acyl carrier protein
MAHSATDVDEVIAILSDSLQLGGRAQQLTVSSRLLGTIPELDSMAIVGVLTAIEERYGFTIDDDEVSADTFATVATLCEFVSRKRSG